MTIISRDGVRSKLVEDLTALHGSNVFGVYGYMKTAFEGKSPIVRILNGGSTRPRRAGYIPQPLGSKFRYVVQHFVLYREQGTSDEQAAAEDKLDAMEAILAQYVADNDQLPGTWKTLEFIDYSDPVLVKINAFQYLLEGFQIEVTVDG